MANARMEALDKVLGYIRDHEQADFYDNPSTNHVYYQLLVYEDGEESAALALKQALEELEGEEL